MAIYGSYPKANNNVIGNISAADGDAGFKSEVKAVFESYTAQGVNLINDLPSVISSPTSKQDFISAVTESMAESPLFTNPVCQKSSFYGNYVDRVDQLLSNTLDTIATESVMTGYAPIVAYNPFFLKKQWIDCVFKDVLMTEIPKTPVIEIGFERRYLRDMEGAEYPLPESLYDTALVERLMNAATGLNISETPVAIALCKNLSLLSDTYIPGVVSGDRTIELTPNISICAVVFTDTTGDTHKVPVNITVDVSTHNFVKGAVKYDVYDEEGEFVETLSDELVGKVNFKEGKVTVMSTTGNVTAVCFRGKTANRYNQRSLDVIRRNEKIEKVMPESGPRLNSAITIEEAADALALQNIDIIADNINIMGSTLANFEDAEIKNFLINSFNAQKAANASGILYNELGDNNMIVESGFNALPYDGYAYTVTEWMKSSREYFERTVGALKTKLRSTNCIIVAVAHPNIIRFLQDGISWVFSDDTQISGVKLSYNFGIYTSAQDRVHVLTSMRLTEEDGIRFVVIPLTQELITFKHYKYNICIDRNYRNPVYTLVPNIMCTQRTLTWEVFPVAGLMSINGREMFSPESLRRPEPPVDEGDEGTP
jgi:hypothetical protein